MPALTRKQAAEFYGLPTFTGIYRRPGDTTDSIMTAVVGADAPERVQQLLFGVPLKDTGGLG